MARKFWHEIWICPSVVISSSSHSPPTSTEKWPKLESLLEMRPWTWRVKLSKVLTKGYVTLYGNYMDPAWLAPLR